MANVTRTARARPPLASTNSPPRRLLPRWRYQNTPGPRLPAWAPTHPSRLGTSSIKRFASLDSLSAAPSKVPCPRAPLASAHVASARPPRSRPLAQSAPVRSPAPAAPQTPARPVYSRDSSDEAESQASCALHGSASHPLPPSAALGGPPRTPPAPPVRIAGIPPRAERSPPPCFCAASQKNFPPTPAPRRNLLASPPARRFHPAATAATGTVTASRCNPLTCHPRLRSPRLLAQHRSPFRTSTRSPPPQSQLTSSAKTPVV